MPVPLQDLLKYVVIGLVWLMFLRISRAIWVEVRSDTKRLTNNKGFQRVPVPAFEGPRASAPGRVPDQSTTEHAPPHLDLMLDDGTTERFVVHDEVTIGRAGGCSIRLDDSFVSSVHARVWVESGKLFVVDLASTNGTSVNSKKIDTKTLLIDGDLVEVGRHRLQVGY